MAGTFVSFPVSDPTGERIGDLAERIGLERSKHPYHVTTVYSKVPIEYARVGIRRYEAGRVKGFMFLKGNTDDLGLTLTLSVQSMAVNDSHYQGKMKGGLWAYPSFRPHITLAYGVNIESIMERVLSLPEPELLLVFNDEEVLELDEDWRPIRN